MALCMGVSTALGKTRVRPEDWAAAAWSAKVCCWHFRVGIVRQGHDRSPGVVSTRIAAWTLGIAVSIRHAEQRQTVQRGLLGAVTFVTERGAIQCPLGLPADECPPPAFCAEGPNISSAATSSGKRMSLQGQLHARARAG